MSLKPRVFAICNCKRSRCVKKYCECFIVGKKCNENCKCSNCKNVDEPLIKKRKKKVKEISKEKISKLSKNWKPYQSLYKLLDE